jgi:tripartite-type tricarboxylate transporter receptor subunit TctC
MKFKKSLALLLSVGLMVGSITGCASTKTDGDVKTETDGAVKTESVVDFPKQDFQGTIMWSAGGICDNVSRAIGPFVEAELGKTIIYSNKPGAAGGISTQYVSDQKSDGYNLLFGAENPQIAKVMGTSTLDYSDFEPISIFSTSVGVVLVSADSKYKTIEDLVEDMKARPNEVIMATTGPGGLPATVASMMKSINGTEPQTVVFDGEAGAITALLGGHVDYTITTYGSSAELLRSGKIVGLAVISDEALEDMKDIPLIMDAYPEYSKYLPWGPFYGVFVKKGTPQETIDILTAAFDKAANSNDFKKLLKDLGNIPLGISGEEARNYIDKYRSVSSWLLYDAGATEKSPEEFGIERPAE